MKTIVLLFTLFTPCIVFSQEFENIQIYKNSSVQHSKEDLLDSLSNFIIIDVEKIDSLIQSSKKKYKIVYLFSHRCHSSLESFPILIEYIHNHPSKFELFPIIGYRYSEIPKIKEYLEHIRYSNPVYILDVEKYGNRKNPFKRLDILVKELCKECEFKKMGFSNFFVFDETKSIVLHNTWEVVELEELDQLKKLPL